MEAILFGPHRILAEREYNGLRLGFRHQILQCRDRPNSEAEHTPYFRRRQRRTSVDHILCIVRDTFGTKVQNEKHKSGSSISIPKIYEHSILTIYAPMKLNKNKPLAPS